MSKSLLFGVTSALTFALASAASAVSMMKISGSGFWASNAPSTAYSQATEAFTFSFQVPATYAYADYGIVKVIDPTEVRDLYYSLGGTALSTSISPVAPPGCAATTGLLCAIELVTGGGGGGLNLDFGDASVDFYSPTNADVGTAGKLSMGAYIFIPNVNGEPSPVDGKIDEGTSTVSLVPEPGTWAMMLVGLSLVGGALRRSRRGPALA
jgi:hypothetical protein